MIAHSLKNKAFGPAQNLHGATYVVDVSFYSENLNPLNVVIDISLAQNILKEALETLRYKNLDDLNELKGKYTTTEFLAKYIHSKVKDGAKEVFTGKISVTLGESHIAWATYEE